MSGSSSYAAKSRFAKWIDERLPLPRLIHDQFIVFATPRNLNIWYAFGGILTFCLGVQILTGIVLAMHYMPDAGLASTNWFRRATRFGSARLTCW